MSPFMQSDVFTKPAEPLPGTQHRRVSKWAEDIESAYHEMAVHVGASVKGLGWGGSARTDVASKTETHALARSFYLRSEYTPQQKILNSRDISRLQFTSDALRLLETSGYSEFRRLYGDGFVAQMSLGGELLATCSYISASRSTLRDIDTKVRAQGLFGSGEIDFSKLDSISAGNAERKEGFHTSGLRLEKSPSGFTEAWQLANDLPSVVANDIEHAAVMSFEVIDYGDLLPQMALGDIGDARAVLNDLQAYLLRSGNSQRAWRVATANASALGLEETACRSNLDELQKREAEAQGLVVQLASSPRDNSILTNAKSFLERSSYEELILGDVLEGPFVRPIAHFGNWERLSGGDNDIHSKRGNRTEASVEFTVVDVKPEKLSYEAYFFVKEVPRNYTKIGGKVRGVLLPEPGFRFVPIDAGDVANQQKVSVATEREVHTPVKISKVDQRFPNSPFSSLRIRFDSKHGDDRGYVGFDGVISLPNVKRVKLQ